MCRGYERRAGLARTCLALRYTIRAAPRTLFFAPRQSALWRRAPMRRRLLLARRTLSGGAPISGRNRNRPREQRRRRGDRLPAVGARNKGDADDSGDARGAPPADPAAPPAQDAFTRRLQILARHARSGVIIKRVVISG